MKKITLLFSILCTAFIADSQITNLPDLDGKFQPNSIPTIINASTNNLTTRSSYNLLPNFPIPFSYGAYDPKGGVVTANLDSDSDLEIVFGCGLHLYGINKDGTIVSGWNKTYATGNDVIWPAAIGDIDGDGNKDVVVIAGSQTAGNVYAYDLNGNLKTGFPFVNIGIVPMMPVLGDIDKDGDNEIIFSKRLSGSAGGEIYVLKGDGTVFPGWPYSMGTGEYPGSSVAVGDINNDGTIEIVGESRNKLWVWNSNATVLTGFPFDLDASNVIINSYSAPILVDIDKDNQHEIVFCAHNPGGIMYVLKNDGTLYSGWPKTTTQWIYAPPIAADINNDGFMELFVQDQISSSTPSSYIYGFDKNGNNLSGFPYGPTFGGLTQLVVADLNNDNDWEFISDDNIQHADTSGQYIAINHDGTAFANFPLVTKGNTYYKQLVLEDIENDGSLDFIGGGIDLNTSVYYQQAWSTSNPFSATKIINPYLQLNKKHDGYYPILSNGIDGDNETDKITTSVYPNPFKNNFKITSTRKIIEVIIIDMQGQLIHQQKNNSKTIEVDIAMQPSGLYIASIMNDNGTVKRIKLVNQQ